MTPILTCIVFFFLIKLAKFKKKKEPENFERDKLEKNGILTFHYEGVYM